MDMRFKFKIDLAEYAKRFGIRLPDDSPDVITDDGGASKGEAKDCDCRDAVAVEDAATVSFGSAFTNSSTGRQIKATFDQCKAKNPMTCRYHGTQILATDIDASLQAAGVNAPVKVEYVGISSSGGKQLLSCLVTVKANEQDQQAVESAMSAFAKNPGVQDMFTYSNGNYHDAGFDIDMLNPNAKAKWIDAMTNPAVPQTAQPGQTVQPPVSAPTAEQQPAAPTAMPVSKRPRPTRKRVKKADPTTEESHTATAEPDKTGAEVANLEGIEVELDPDAPTLYPDQAPPKPPDWTPPFDANELATLANVTNRLLKTARQINNHIDKGTTDAWLQGKSPNLPDSLQKFKNQVDGDALKALSDKDTAGQLKPFVDLFDEISKSEANGWKDRVAESLWDSNAHPYWEKDPNKKGNIDLHFDSTKYVDPYAKERAAYEAYVPVDNGRDTGLGAASQVEKAKGKDAPKKAAEDAKVAAKEMTDLEEGFKTLSDAPKPVLKLLAQAYHKANERFKDGVAKCKKWLAKQVIAQDTIKGTIEALKNADMEVPAELNNLEDVQSIVEDDGWRQVASYYGLSIAKKQEYMENFRKNMRAYFAKCNIFSSYNIDDVCMQILDNEFTITKFDTTRHKNNHCFHASCNSYVYTQNAVFGLRETKKTASAKRKMHAYGTVDFSCLADESELRMYQGDTSCVTILTNPKIQPIAAFGRYYSTSNYFKKNQDPRTRYYTGCYVNAPDASMFAQAPEIISKDAFTKNLSNLDAQELQQALGLHYQSMEAWPIGGIHEKAMLAIKEQHDSRFTKAQINAFNKKGITILDVNGNLRGKDMVPDDPDLVLKVYGKKGRPK